MSGFVIIGFQELTALWMATGTKYGKSIWHKVNRQSSSANHYGTLSIINFYQCKIKLKVSQEAPS